MSRRTINRTDFTTNTLTLVKSFSVFYFREYLVRSNTPEKSPQILSFTYKTWSTNSKAFEWPSPNLPSNFLLLYLSLGCQTLCSIFWQLYPVHTFQLQDWLDLFVSSLPLPHLSFRKSNILLETLIFLVPNNHLFSTLSFSSWWQTEPVDHSNNGDRF